MKSNYLYIPLLLVQFCLTACGGIYHVDPIIKTECDKAVSWREYSGFACKLTPWWVVCGEEDKNEYINPYTYNPAFVGKKGKLNSPGKSLYAIASTVGEPVPFQRDNIIDPCGLADNLKARDHALSKYLFKSYSTGNAGADKIRCDKADKDENVAREIVANELITLLNDKLATYDLYHVAGLDKSTLKLPELLIKLSEPPSRNEGNMLGFNKNLLSTVYGKFLRKDFRLFDQPRLARNSLQMAIMRVSDWNTAKHLAASKANQTNLNLLFGLSTTGLAGGAVVASQATAQALAAAAGGTNAARSIVSDNIYRDVLVESLINTIQTDRQKIKEQIERNLLLPITEYDVERAIYDALTYHEAGSFYSGLASMRTIIEDGNSARKKTTLETHEMEAQTDFNKKKLEKLKAEKEALNAELANIKIREAFINHSSARK